MVTQIKSAHGFAYSLELREPLRALTPDQITTIDRALAELGPYSQLRLVKQKGVLRFIIRVESKDILSDA